MFSLLPTSDTLFALVLEVLFVIIWVGTIFVVITENRNPVKTLAWVMVLVFLPVIGFVLYVFFGMDMRQEKVIGKRSLSKLLKEALINYKDYAVPAPPPPYEKLVRMMRHANQSYLLAGNKVTTFTDFPSMLYDLLRTIASARQHIHVQFYIFMDDAVGRLLRDALIDKAQQGVKVRLLYDDVGSWRVKKRFFRTMKEAGIEVYPFGEVKFAALAKRANYRNHRKVVVIDGKVGYIGGMNVAERYYKGVAWGRWRDTHIRIDGMAANALQTSFFVDWYYATRVLVSDSCCFPKVPRHGNTDMQIVTSYPMGEWKTIMQGMLQVICQSRRYLYIQTPYFLPTEPILTALRNAALAGVDVRLMVPRHGDSLLADLASHSYYKEVMTAGVKIYQYEAGYLHAKVMLADDNFVTVGSTNFDFRSFEHNFEINAFIYDPVVVKDMKRIFMDDLKHSSRIIAEKWRKRPLWNRFWESLVRLLSPLL